MSNDWAKTVSDGWAKTVKNISGKKEDKKRVYKHLQINTGEVSKYLSV